MDLDFAGRKDIRLRAAHTNIIANISGDQICPTATQDTIISIEAINNINAGTGKNQIVATRAGNCPDPNDKVSHINPGAGGGFESIQPDGNCKVAKTSGWNRIRRRDRGYNAEQDYGQ